MVAGSRIYLDPGDEILQGDIYTHVPAIHIPARPVAVARFHKKTDEREVHGVHYEDGKPPSDGFRWQSDKGGETVLARGFMGMAVLISQDCEIENDLDHRLVAMIRPITEIQPEHRANMMAMKSWAAFPLPAQAEAPAIVESFVDFRRITSLRPEALRPEDRVAHIGPNLLAAMRVRFWYFLNRRVVELPANQS